MTGIIAGAVGAALLLGGGVAYLVYYRVAAVRNEKAVSFCALVHCLLNIDTWDSGLAIGLKLRFLRILCTRVM